MKKLNKTTRSFDTETSGYLNTTAEYEIVGSIKVWENKLVRTRTDYSGYCEKTDVITNCVYILYLKQEDGTWEETGRGYYQSYFNNNDDDIRLVHNDILNKILN